MKFLYGFGVVALLVGVGSLAVSFFQSPVSSPPPPLDQFVNKTLSENRDLPPFAPETVVSPTPAPTPAPASGTFCTGNNASNFDCYETYFTNLVKDKGVKAAFTVLRAVYPVNPYVKSQCHPLTHVIGRVATLQYPNVGDAYKEGDGFCWSGYYHGVMEGIIGKIGRKNLPAQMNGICADLAAKRKYSFDHYNCVHGLGHGVMAITEDELFESLALCDNLTDSWDAASCHSGAFMENIIVDGKNHFTKYLKTDEPLYPCDAVGEKYKQTCYLMQTSYMLKVKNGDFNKVFSLCAGADANFVDICYQSLGRDASGRSVSNVAQTRMTCNLGKDYEQSSNCIIGAVKDFISYYHGDTEAKQLCASLEPDLSKVCVDTADSYVKIL